jgi:hypothetical protein
VNPADFPNASVTSKLVVTREYRNSTLAYRLAARTYADGLATGVRYNFVDCDRALVPFYERLGYRIYRSIRYRYPEGGEGVVMVLGVQDEAYLREVCSPFLKLYMAWKGGAAVK